MKKLLTFTLLLLGSAGLNHTFAQGGRLDWTGGAIGIALADTTAMTTGQYMFARITGGDTTFHFGTPAGSGGTVTSVAMTTPTGLTVAGSPITGTGTFAVTYTAGYVGYTTTEASKLAGIASGATNNPASTVGANILNATNPSAVTWLRVNADNTVTFRSAAQTLADIGAAPTVNPTFTGMLNADSGTFNWLTAGTFSGGFEADSVVFAGFNQDWAITTNSDGKAVDYSTVKFNASQLAFFNGTLRSKITLDCPTDLVDFNPVLNTEVMRDCFFSIVEDLLRGDGYGMAN